MVDILFLSKNREEFTIASMEALWKNTNWDLVNSAWFYHDGPLDSERWESLLSGKEGFIPKPWPWALYSANYIFSSFGSPVAITNHFLDHSPYLPKGPADIFVKVDNDLILCPGWLEMGLKVMADWPNVDLLGIEPHTSVLPTLYQFPGLHAITATPTDHIGGIGFFRRRAFAGRTRPQPNGRYGFTEWQWANPDIVKAWINPPMPVFLLDHLPREPWRTLSREYEAKGWQRRQWGEYEERSYKLWEWWVK